MSSSAFETLQIKFYGLLRSKISIQTIKFVASVPSYCNFECRAFSFRPDQSGFKCFGALEIRRRPMTSSDPIPRFRRQKIENFRFFSKVTTFHEIAGNDQKRVWEHQLSVNTAIFGVRWARLSRTAASLDPLRSFERGYLGPKRPSRNCSPHGRVFPIGSLFGWVGVF